MKKYLFAILSGLMMVSCLSDGDYYQTSPIYATFEYNKVDFDADSLFFKTEQGYGIGWTYLGFLHKVDTLSWTFNGGVLLSAQKGKLYDPADTAAISKSDSLVFAQDRFRLNSKKDTLNNK